MFFTVDQLIAHAFGDYILQSHWMATSKTKRWVPAAIHVLLYGIPFLFLTRSVPALIVIVGTHFAIDHWRLARYVIWFKNFLAPPHSNPSWEECRETGFPPETPPFLAVWLLIVVDNIIHVCINAGALHWLG